MANSGTTAYSSQKKLELAFCIDLSGSTNGLINDVRDQVWQIINHLHSLSPAPDVRIAFVGFSRPSFGKANAYTKVLTDFTDDPEKAVCQLYRLRPSIEKGDQFVAQAILTSVRDLSWSVAGNSQKFLFVIGNGMASTDDGSHVRAVQSARQRGIIVNTLYVTAGGNLSKELPGWRAIAETGGGYQSEISVLKSDTTLYWPVTASGLKRVNEDFNSSYRWTEEKSSCKAGQHSCDSAAWLAGPQVFAQRLYYKSTRAYTLNKQSCDFVSELIISGNTGSSPNEYYELKSVRDRAVAQIRKELSPFTFSDVHRRYRDGEMKDENVFSRSVLNMLIKQWR